MSLKRKLEGEIEIRATAADVHHDIYMNRPHHVSHAASHFIQGVDLHEGAHGKVGSTFVWKYSLGGKALVAKSVIDEIDEEKKLVKYRGTEGDIFEEYKSFNAICQVIAKDDETSIVKWTFEYEKRHPGIPEPTQLLDSFLSASKDIDDHYHGNK